VAPHQQRLIPIDEAAMSSGRTADDLRRWCATGRLRCERVATDWYLLEDDLHLAATLDDINEQRGERTVVSMAFRDEPAGRRALEQLRRAFDAPATRLRLAPLALDGTAMVLVAGSFPVDRLDEVVAATHGHGGVVVDGVDEARLGPAHRRTSPVDDVCSPYG
jgi:hypothetical protein